MNPDALFARLVGVEVVLVGGLAAVFHGASVLTADVDFCYESSPENRQQLADALRPLEPYPRGIDRGLPFAWDARTLRDTPLMTLMTTAGDVDLMTFIPGVGAYADVRAQSERIDVDGVPLHVLSLAALIAAKRAMNRPKDRLVLPELEAIAAVRPPRQDPRR